VPELISDDNIELLRHDTWLKLETASNQVPPDEFSFYSADRNPESGKSSEEVEYGCFWIIVGAKILQSRIPHSHQNENLHVEPLRFTLFQVKCSRFVLVMPEWHYITKRRIVYILLTAWVLNSYMKYANDTVIVGFIANNDENNCKNQIPEDFHCCQLHNLSLNVTKIPKHYIWF